PSHHVRRRRHRRCRRALARPWGRTDWGGGAVRENESARLHPRARRHHRRTERADRLTTRVNHWLSELADYPHLPAIAVFDPAVQPAFPGNCGVRPMPDADLFYATERACRPAGENAAPSIPLLIIRSGTIRIHAESQPGPNFSPPAECSSARPRTSIPRGVQGATLARSSITRAVRGLACRSRHFFEPLRPWPPTSIACPSA